MCGRYVLAKDYEELKARFGLTQSDFTMKPRYNIAPQQENPVIVKSGKLSGEGARQHHELSDGVVRQHNESGQHIELMQWGLVPHWAKDPALERGYKMINARAESVAEKPSFREPFKKQRCKNGFSESAFCFC